MIFLPEIRLKRVCDALIEYLVSDLKSCIKDEKENESYLYLLFHADKDDKNESVNYNEAKQIFLRKESDPRYLKICPVFDRRRAAVPTIHIVIPQDNEEFRQIGDIEGDLYESENALTEKIERGYICQFNLLTTSDNINEVLLINYVLRALLLSSNPQLQMIGFINPSFSVQDLNINPELFPANAYIKGILMTATYAECIPQLNKEDKTETIIFDINKIIY